MPGIKQSITREGEHMSEKQYTIGIDLSYHNIVNNYQAIKEDEIDFVILRSSYRTTSDSKYGEYVQGFLNAGIPVVAIYHFIYALNKEAAEAEAHFAANQAMSAGLNPEEIIIFSDFEYDTVKKAAEKSVILGPKECREFTKAFCDTVKDCGWKAGIYTNKDYYKNWYGPEFLKDYVVWLADYEGDPDYPCVLQQFTPKGIVNGIDGKVDMNYMIKPSIFKMGKKEEENKMIYSREQIVNQARAWIGRNEKDGSHKEIIDIYNNLAKPLPRSTKMQYDWPWCACFWSAVALKLGYSEIIPIEISCALLIQKAQEMGIWVENDAYVPSIGDGVVYDWQDNGVGDNTGWPDHIGIVESVGDGRFSVIEGNYGDTVQTRSLKVNDKFIRGFISPRYSEIEIAEKEPTKTHFDLEISSLCLPDIAGDYVATGDLNCRKGPGTTKDSLFVIKKGTKVYTEGDCGIVGLTVWPKVYVGEKAGYCSGKYLERA